MDLNATDIKQDALTWNSEMHRILDNIPEKPSIDVLQDFNDIIIYKGLKQLDAMIEDSEETSMQKTKVFNALVGLGRYIDQRREHEMQINRENTEIEFTENTLVVNAKKEN